jgi:protein gp138/GpV-like protein with Apex motif
MTDPFIPTKQNPVPPDLRSLFTSLGFEIKKQINCARPGIVQSFNSGNATAIVQIAQQQVTSVSPAGVRTLAAFSPLVEVPVYTMGGGGVTVTFPIAAGDECIVLFCDREIDNWLQSGGTDTAPTTPRLHDLADGIALVGIRSFPRSLSGYSANSAQLRSDDGTVTIDLNPSTQKISLISPTEILLNAPAVVITGTIDVQNDGVSSTPCIINGSITATGDIVSGTISLQSHVHTGVQSGGDDTGGPVG